jgi:hypothetical protein
MDGEVHEEHPIPLTRRLLKVNMAVERDPPICLDCSLVSRLWMPEFVQPERRPGLADLDVERLRKCLQPHGSPRWRLVGSARCGRDGLGKRIRPGDLWNGRLGVGRPAASDQQLTRTEEKCRVKVRSYQEGARSSLVPHGGATAIVAASLPLNPAWAGRSLDMTHK